MPILISLLSLSDFRLSLARNLGPNSLDIYTSDIEEEADIASNHHHNLTLL